MIKNGRPCTTEEGANDRELIRNLSEDRTIKRAVDLLYRSIVIGTAML